MSIHVRNLNFPGLPERISGLGELAENLWWSWHPSARNLFKRLDRSVWKETTHNPDKMLREISEEALKAAAGDPDYLRHYDVVMSQFHKYQAAKPIRQFDLSEPDSRKIVYFSAEYGLHHSLPFYAGGLGFLAGDHIKEASDLRLPLVAVGFMYPDGYLYQQIGEDGWQQNIAQRFDREAAAISKVIDENGNQLVVRVPMVEPPIHAAIWQVDVGRIPLFLLDTDIDQNDPWNRTISSRLYIGDNELRLRQEIVLGLGGSEMLEKIGIEKLIVHLNEGHAGFAQLERIRERINAGESYETAFEQVKKTSVFTTHTPVPAGHDVFPFYLIEKYFHAYWPALQLDRESFLHLGVHPDDPSAGFNMTAMLLKTAQYCNGVSRKHGEVTRRMWRGLWPDTPEEKIPIDSITNGIHVPTWIEPKMELLFNKYLGPGWLDSHDDPTIWEMVDEIPGRELWDTHYWLKIKLIDTIRERARRRWVAGRTSPSIVLSNGAMLDPSVLTLGFARRFASYKRAELIFTDPDRLKKLLNDPLHPIQIVFAGKAHPADDPGKRILQRIVNESRNPEMGGRIAFVENYGEQLAQYLVHGVDIWLNNPRPPMEASGTSGMKASLNGVPNLSILDGWWIEGYDGTNGWAFRGDDAGGENDAADAARIYEILENKAIPLYYRVSDEGYPEQWVDLMKRAISTTAARFSSRRMVREYIDKFYSKAMNAIK